MTVLTLALVASLTAVSPPPVKVSFTEKIFCTIPDDIKYRYLTVSPTGAHVAYMANRGGTWHMVLDKKFGPGFSSISGKPYFLADGKTVVYTANVGGLVQLFVGGRAAMRESIVGKPVFSPNLKKFAFVAKKLTGGGNVNAKVYFAVVNGKKGPMYEGVGNPAFSADGGSWAHSVQFGLEGGRNYGTFGMVVNGRVVGQKFLRIGNPVYAPKGKSMAFWADSGDLSSVRKVMVVNGRVHPGNYTEIGPPSFSPDGRRIGYTASPDSRKRFMVIDGKPQQDWDYLGFVVWNKTGSSYAYRAQKGQDHFIIHNGKASKRYKGVGEPSFSHDGKTLAHGIRINTTKWGMCIGGKEGPTNLDAIYSQPICGGGGGGSDQSTSSVGFDY